MRRPVATLGQGDTPAAWFASLPIVTKTLCVGTLLCSGLVTFGWISPMQIVFDFPAITQRFELWRLVTPYFFAGTFSFSFLVHLLVLYENCVQYERMPFNTGGGGTSADFVWMLCLAIVPFSILGCVVGFLGEQMGFSEALLFMIIYVRTRREPEEALNMFGFKFQAIYLPQIYLAIPLFMGNSIMTPLRGISVGHLYYLLAGVMGNELVRTPAFVVRLVEYVTGVARPSGPNLNAGQPT